MTPQPIKTLLTNSPQIGHIMEVTKCFAAFIGISKDLYVTQYILNQLHLIQSVIISCDIKETIVNKSTTQLFEKKCPF